jgi:hypothetical protein
MSERPPAVRLLRKLGLEPDPWQIDVLESDHPRILLNCSRQAGKSTAVAMVALAEAVFLHGSMVLLLSRSHRQALELYGTVLDFFKALGSSMVERCTFEAPKLANKSRIVALPCKEETIRGYSGVTLLVIDEAARVPDDLYNAVRPMLAVSGGRLICLSTPYGKRGFFYDTWATGGDTWKRVEIPATMVPRIRPEFLEEERRTHTAAFYRQEYCCSFESLEGLVYPDFDRCVEPGPAPAGRRVGGIDYGFRNPFAALWGVLDRDGVLWLVGEHYSRERPLTFHAQHLPRDVSWYGDPSGPAFATELRCAGFKVQPGHNDVLLGISAVRARLEHGTLRVVAGACPNLLAEAGVYRYEGERGSEQPVAEYNHALDALRYLVSKVDERYMARLRQPSSTPAAPAEAPPAQPKPPRRWLSVHNDQLWDRRWTFRCGGD